jgi:hypothetical protein
MFCSQCGSYITSGAAACSSCGTPLATPGTAGSAQSATRVTTARPAVGGTGQAAGQPVQFDAHRWTRSDVVTGVGTVLLLISLFLPWYGVTLFGISAEADGLTGHGYLYIVLLLCLAILGYLGVRAASEELPARMPLTHEQRLLIAVGLNAVLVLLAFLVKPAETGWRFGAFTGLLAALVAVAPLIAPALRARRVRA